MIRAFFVLIIVGGLATSGSSARLEIFQENAQQEAVDSSDAFITDVSGKAAKSALDMKFLEHALKPGYLYSHASMLKMKAKGKSVEDWGFTEKEAELIFAVDQAWDSYILCNADGDILELRMFLPSKVLTMSTTARYEIKGLKQIPFGEWGAGLKSTKSSYSGLVGSILDGAARTAGGAFQWVDKKLGQEWYGEEARKMLKDSNNRFSGFTEPTLFSGKRISCAIR